MARRRSGPAIVHFTRAMVVWPAIELLEKMGCPVWRYLSEAHLSPALLEAPETAVPVRLAHDFVSRASRGEGIDHLALRIGESMRLERLGAFGQRLLHSRNLFDYFRTGCRLVPNLTTNERYWLEFEQDRVRFCQADTDLEQPLQSYLLALACTIRTVRATCGGQWIPCEVTLPGEVPPGLADVSPVFAHVRTDATRSFASFTFPRTFLSQRLPPAGRPEVDRETLDFATPHPSDFTESVRRLAEVLVLDGHADLPAAAESSGMTLRTFQRRLAECGLSFSRLVLEARMTLSEKWLREGDRPITDVAFSLGYNDAANFTRAFRRVNGLSPRAYRSGLADTRPVN